MNTRALAVFTLCVIGAALLWNWFLLSREPEPVPPRSSTLSGHIARGPDRTPAAPAAWPARDTAEFRERLRDPAARWLDSRGRDAAGLVAIWDLCRDVDILHEAASRFPNDPRVCRAMVEVNTGQPDHALFWIEKLIALEPDNSEGNYLKAWALFAKDDLHAGLAALRAATANGLPRESHLRDRATALRDAAVALGSPGRVSDLAPIAFLREQSLGQRFYDRALPAISTLMEEAHKQGDVETAAALGRTALAAALNQAAGFDSPLLISGSSATNRFVRAILNKLPDDWAWQPGQLTAAEWKTHAMEQCMDLGRSNTLARRADERLAGAPDEVVAEYSRRFLSRGEVEANAWLLARAAPAQ